MMLTTAPRLVRHVKGALAHFHAVYFGEVDVLRRRIHMAGAGAVRARTVDQDVDVVLLETTNDQVVGDSRLADLPHSIQRRQRFTGILGRALPHTAHVQQGLVGGRRSVNLDGLPVRGNLEHQRHPSAAKLRDPDRLARRYEAARRGENGVRLLRARSRWSGQRELSVDVCLRFSDGMSAGQ